MITTVSKGTEEGVKLTDDTILEIAEKMDEIRIIGAPKFCKNNSITMEQLNEISTKTGVEIPKYRSLKKEQLLALEQLINEVKAMSAEVIKNINFVQLSTKYKINASTVKRSIRKEIPNFDNIKKGIDTEVTKADVKKAAKKKTVKHSTKRSDAADKAVEYLMKHPEVTHKEAAKKFNTSVATIGRRLRAMKEENKIKATESAKAVAIEKEYVDNCPNMEEVKRGNATMIEVKMDNYIVIAALMGERHEWPTELSIFTKGTLTSSELFNFRWQEEQVTKFIDEWIPFVDGKATKKLGIYLCGSQMVYGSLIKVCERRKVNLDVFHYNTDTYQYVTQSIFGDFEMAMLKNETLYNLLTKSSKFGGLYTINCNFDKINHITSELYMVRKMYYSNPSSTTYSRVEYVIVQGLENCWTIFGRFIEEFREMNKSGKATITPIKLTNDEKVIEYDKDVVSQKINLYGNTRAYTIKMS